MPFAPRSWKSLRDYHIFPAPTAARLRLHHKWRDDMGTFLNGFRRIFCLRFRQQLDPFAVGHRQPEPPPTSAPYLSPINRSTLLAAHRLYQDHPRIVIPETAPRKNCHAGYRHSCYNPSLTDGKGTFVTVPNCCLMKLGVLETDDQDGSSAVRRLRCRRRYNFALGGNMRNRMLLFSISVVALAMVMAALKPNLGVYAEEPTEIRGSMVVIGPTEKELKGSPSGQRLDLKKGELRIEELKFETGKVNFRGSQVDLESPEVKTTIERTIESVAATLRMEQKESQKLEAASRTEGIDVAFKSRAHVRDSAISFDYDGAGEIPLKVAAGGEKAKSGTMERSPAGARAVQRLALQTGKTNWKGTITNFKTSVKELAPFNGATMKVTSTSNISQVELAGSARSQVAFVLRVQAAQK